MTTYKTNRCTRCGETFTQPLTSHDFTCGTCVYSTIDGVDMFSHLDDTSR